MILCFQIYLYVSQFVMCTPVVITALFTIARTWKQPRCPLADEWIIKLWYIYTMKFSVQFSSVQSLSHVRLYGTPRTAALQASLSITNPWSLLKLMSIELVMPSNQLMLCRPLLLPSVFPSIRVFSKESVLHIR